MTAEEGNSIVDAGFLLIVFLFLVIAILVMTHSSTDSNSGAASQRIVR